MRKETRHKTFFSSTIKMSNWNLWKRVVVFSDQIKILPPHNNGSEYFRKKHSNFNVQQGFLEIHGFELIPKTLDYVSFRGFFAKIRIFRKILSLYVDFAQILWLFTNLMMHVFQVTWVFPGYQKPTVLALSEIFFKNRNAPLEKVWA